MARARSHLALVAAAVAIVGGSVWLWRSIRIEAEPSPPSPPSPPSAVSPAVPRPTTAVADVETDAGPVVASPDADRSDVDSRARRAADARERLLARVRDHGTNLEPWVASGRAVLAKLASTASASADDGCYMAGCTVTLTFATRATFDSAVAAWRATPEVHAWTGGVQVSDPEVTRTGAVIVAVVLFRPD